MTMLIKNGTIVTASDVYNADILIRSGQIAEIGKDIAKITEEVIDATDKYVLPGGIDAHTHLGHLWNDIATADDFESGTAAAAFGGTTTIIDYAVQAEGGSLQEAMQASLHKAEGKAAVDYSFHIIITDLNEAVLGEMPRLIDSGITSFKCPPDGAAIFQALQVAKEHGGLICVLAENREISRLIARRMLAEGKTEPRYYALSWPPELEGEAAGRAIALAELLRAPIYLSSLSAAHALEKVKASRDKGCPTFAETCYQYLVLSQDACDGPDFEGAKYVCKPPLRPRWHQDLLWKGLASSDIQVVASDHCSFNFRGQKELGRDDFTKIPVGLPTIENRLQVLYTSGVVTGKISINRLVDVTATMPAKIFGLFPRKGTIAIGSDADLVVFDPKAEQIISSESHHMRVDYNPFEGFRAKGAIVAVVLRGNIIVRNGKFLGRPGSGEFIRRRPFAMP